MLGWQCQDPVRRRTRGAAMPVRRRGNKLERWEIALIKAMVADGRWPNDQDILAYFTRPTRSINHRRGQRASVLWTQMAKLTDEFLPKPQILHPWPSVRFSVRHPR
jgi:hypothetical protein